MRGEKPEATAFCRFGKSCAPHIKDQKKSDDEDIVNALLSDVFFHFWDKAQQELIVHC